MTISIHGADVCYEFHVSFWPLCCHVRLSLVLKGDDRTRSMAWTTSGHLFTAEAVGKCRHARTHARTYLCRSAGLGLWSCSSPRWAGDGVSGDGCVRLAVQCPLGQGFSPWGYPLFRLRRGAPRGLYSRHSPCPLKKSHTSSQDTGPRWVDTTVPQTQLRSVTPHHSDTTH